MKLKQLAFCSALFSAMAAMAPAQAVTIVSTVTLSGAAESPPNASPGTGLGIITVNTALSTMRVQEMFLGLTGTTTASHIHCCTALPGTGTAGVASVTPTFTGFPSGVTSGSYDVTFDMTLSSSWNPAFVTANGGTTASAFATLVSGISSGEAYLNLHTSTFAGGEIRGFLQPNLPIPEPGTYALMAAGLGIVGWAARRRVPA